MFMVFDKNSMFGGRTTGTRVASINFLDAFMVKSRMCWQLNFFLMQMVSRTEGNIDDSLIGGNASAEGPEGEGTEGTVVTGVDIVMNHHLQETSFTKEAYKKYIKDYMKS